MSGFIDGSIVEKGKLYEEYNVPKALADGDMFEMFRKKALKRGWSDLLFANKWFVIGFPGSGTSLHADYWDTPFWNACLYGRKRWVILDRSTPAELTGIYEQMDAFEWFNTLYKHLRLMKNITWWEFYQDEGDIVYSPGGFFHNTLNTGPSISVSENLIFPENVPMVFKAICDVDSEHYQPIHCITACTMLADQFPWLLEQSKCKSMLAAGASNITKSELERQLKTNGPKEADKMVSSVFFFAVTMGLIDLRPHLEWAKDAEEDLDEQHPISRLLYHEGMPTDGKPTWSKFE